MYSNIDNNINYKYESYKKGIIGSVVVYVSILMINRWWYLVPDYATLGVFMWCLSQIGIFTIAIGANYNYSKVIEKYDDIISKAKNKNNIELEKSTKWSIFKYRVTYMLVLGIPFILHGIYNLFK
jgi:hypothetical protein